MFFSLEGSSEVLICLCPQVLKPVVSPEVNHGLGNRRLINFSLSGKIPTSIFLSFHPSLYCFSPELKGHLIGAFTHTEEPMTLVVLHDLQQQFGENGLCHVTST